ncbi:hypothetical protein [Streptomyces sp. NPDC126503]|uniref:hypothetical protein n=1 Tax=Streptomyces sp. NPDC126503 TaxID=3155315 RepID=UPI0033337DBB
MSKPTVDQLLNLADRAEYGGGLTQAEADRLRAGIAALSASEAALTADKASLIHRLRAYTRQSRSETAADLTAVHRLVARSALRGVSHLPVWAVAAASGAPIPHRYSRAEQNGPERGPERPPKRLAGFRGTPGT